jgi:hypothetical protein
MASCEESEDDVVVVVMLLLYIRALYINNVVALMCVIA